MASFWEQAKDRAWEEAKEAAPKLVRQEVVSALSAPSVQADIRKLGERAADKVYESVIRPAFKSLLPAGKKPPAKPIEKSWVEETIQPVITPFLGGFTSRLKERLKPAAAIVMGLLAATHVGAFLAGRFTADRE